MPYRIEGAEGKLYRPSSGTEGLMFYESFCALCRYDDGDRILCDIIGRSYAYDTDHESYPREWIHDGAGRPTCTKFSEGEPGTEPDPPPIDVVLRFLGEPELFEDATEDVEPVSEAVTEPEPQ